MWKLLDEFPVIEVSDKGEIRYVGTEKPVPAKLNPSSGYQYVNIGYTKHRKNRSLHTLIAETFISHQKTTKNYIVNHIDGNKLNNNVNNLEYITHAENIEHAYQSGLNSHSNLTADKVREMRKLREYGSSIRELAKKYAVSNSTVASICGRRTWKHVE